MKVNRSGQPGNYLRPNFLYPEALQYQLAKGVTKRCSHGRLTMAFARDGADMLGKEW
jgi:hypothetical protein